MCQAVPVCAQAVQEAFFRDLELDTVGFAGAVIIRRILGIAHVVDFESIEDPATRCKLPPAMMTLPRPLFTVIQKGPGRPSGGDGLAFACPAKLLCCSLRLGHAMALASRLGCTQAPSVAYAKQWPVPAHSAKLRSRT